MDSRAQHFVECENCEKPGKYFCNPCQSKLCGECVSPHLKLKSAKGHEIVEYHKRKDANNCCAEHPDFDCHVFCKSCNLPICFICTSTKHKPHDMEELSEVLKDFGSRIQNESWIMNSKIKPTYRKILAQMNSTLYRVPLRYQQAHEEVENTRKIWKEKIDSIADSFHDEISELEKTQESSLENQIEAFSKRLDNLDSVTKNNDSLLGLKMLDFKDYHRATEEIPCLHEFIFPTLFTGFVNNLPKKKDFGNVSRLASCELPAYDLQIKEKLDKRKETDSLTLIWSTSTDFPSDDKNKRLYDMAYLSHTRFWVAGNSNALFLLGPENHTFDVMQTPSKVKHLTISSDGVLYYINGINNMIHRITNEGSFEAFISTDIWKPRDIASSLTEGIYVSLFRSENSKVVHYKKSGEIQQEIQFDSSKQPIYADPKNIAINKNGDVCVVDSERLVTVVNSKGERRFSYFGDVSGKYKHFRPMSIATDNACNILVCDLKNNSVIHVLNQDGRFIQFISSNSGFHKPSVITVTEDGNLAVAESVTGVVKVFKYEY